MKCAWCEAEVRREEVYEYFTMDERTRKHLVWCDDDCYARWLAEHPREVLTAIRAAKASGYVC